MGYINEQQLGFRASLYNACPIEAVEALVQCMQDFEKANK